MRVADDFVESAPPKTNFEMSRALLALAGAAALASAAAKKKYNTGAKRIDDPSILNVHVIVHTHGAFRDMAHMGGSVHTHTSTRPPPSAPRAAS
jgi:hypothetical protein